LPTIASRTVSGCAISMNRGTFNPKTEVAIGSAPAPGAVFRALLRRAKARQRDGGAENIVRSEKFQAFEVFRTPNGWIRGRIQQRPGRACSPTSKAPIPLPVHVAHGARIASLMPWMIFLSAGLMVASTPPSCGRAASPSPATK